jgi:HlyD family secretion protein
VDTGQVSTLGVEEQRVNVLIDIMSPPKDWIGLGDGHQVSAQIIVFVRDDAIIVPAGALFRHAGSWAVFVVADGRAQVHPVTLMRRSGRYAAVATGISPGERVILYPSDRVAADVGVETR